jgi:hypothetical protein
MQKAIPRVCHLSALWRPSNFSRTFLGSGTLASQSGTYEWNVRGTPYISVCEIHLGTTDELMVLGVFHGAQDR